MSITWQMAYIDGGGETAWIQAMDSTRVPAPGSMVLVALSLLGMGFSSRRRSK
jgi:hypothetical protein